MVAVQDLYLAFGLTVITSESLELDM